MNDQLEQLNVHLSRFLPARDRFGNYTQILETEGWDMVDRIELLTTPDTPELPVIQKMIIDIIERNPEHFPITLRLDTLAIAATEHDRAVIYYCDPSEGSDSDHSEWHESNLYFLDGRQFVFEGV